MAKKVLFYANRSEAEMREIPPTPLDPRMLAGILKFFEATEVEYIRPLAIAGFKSGLDWGKLKTEGAVAVVLYDDMVHPDTETSVCLETTSVLLPVYLVNRTFRRIMRCTINVVFEPPVGFHH